MELGFCSEHWITTDRGEKMRIPSIDLDAHQPDKVLVGTVDADQAEFRMCTRRSPVCALTCVAGGYAAWRFATNGQTLEDRSAREMSISFQLVSFLCHSR